MSAENKIMGTVTGVSPSNIYPSLMLKEGCKQRQSLQNSLLLIRSVVYSRMHESLLLCASDITEKNFLSWPCLLSSEGYSTVLNIGAIFMFWVLIDRNKKVFKLVK